ncbi:uncharacterized protein L969DRAFT_104787 [Mixia osmundae IAM 14324]|uniref:Uncharacterized protein n=1 Tax=Mixia osmundae (strain CBS 9802 / IAM 14324 / JCM 22182 / KY 12970) TaxID=764103 RepID=G7DS78_MIXOS|nr:uncharacterized protein L969DRAFT_104787 [Mixia osmundae IAM 14324]KEI37509.1 hypothetical protein L969DRAFT_104787 [Mixia osmundae IAM 14324]GAA93438.1 hypothetical protein E5Q_00079 [Mixia osmundae IAM 14324]
MSERSLQSYTATGRAIVTDKEQTTGGDDLEENYVLEDEDVIASSSKAADEEIVDEEAASLLAAAYEDALHQTDLSPKQQGKRRQSQEPVEQAEAKRVKPDRKEAKKLKLRQAKQRRQQERAVILDSEQRLGAALARLPPSLQADLLAEKQLKALPNLSDLERDSCRVSERCLQDTSAFADEAYASLTSFIRAFAASHLASLSKLPKSKGSPRIIVLAGAALRAADLTRALRPLAGDVKVAKLFGKHFKLDEHVKWCQSTDFTIASGTPDRVGKLLHADSLQLSSCSFLVLDGSFRDAKNRQMLDLPEVRAALFKNVLQDPRVSQRLEQGKLKLVLY